MNQTCNDIFREQELPFRTFFLRHVHHENQVHDEIELIWVLKGKMEVICENNFYELTDQTLFMLNIGQVHTVHADDAVIITYRFKKEHLIENQVLFDQYQFENRVYTFEELVIKYKEVPLLIAQLLQILLKPQDNFIRYKVVGYYNMFVYELYTMLQKEKRLDVKSKNYDEYLKRVKDISEYVKKNFRDKIKLDVLAKKVELSTYRLSHFVKEYFGISLQEYTRKVRLDHALKLLKESKRSVVDISADSGFSDVKYLNQAMKNRLGLTALKYRKLVNITAFNIPLDIEEFKVELRQCLEKLELSLDKEVTL